MKKHDIRVTRSLVLCVVVCRSLSVILSFFFCPLRCTFVYVLRFSDSDCYMCSSANSIPMSCIFEINCKLLYITNQFQ